MRDRGAETQGSGDKETTEKGSGDNERRYKESGDTEKTDKGIVLIVFLVILHCSVFTNFETKR